MFLFAGYRPRDFPAKKPSASKEHRIMAEKKSASKAAPKAAAAGKPASKTKTAALPVKTSARAKATKASKPLQPPVAPKLATPTVITLKHLAEQFSESHSMPKKQAEAVLMNIVGLLVTHLTAGNRLRINGLGILEVKDRPARTGRNPATGASIQIAASKKIAFRPSKELKAAI
jgi:DNA-binding protein HU-beta